MSDMERQFVGALIVVVIAIYVFSDIWHFLEGVK